MAKSPTGNGIGIKIALWLIQVKGLTGLTGHDSLALQQDERFAMPWNDTDREKYAVIRERYATDLSDEEFALVQPLLPASKQCGRKLTDPRAILNALFYLVRAGCPWRYLRRTFLPLPQCKIASTHGATAVCENRSSVPWSWPFVRQKEKTQRRPSPS